jgi:hypothetical protein
MLCPSCLELELWWRVVKARRRWMRGRSSKERMDYEMSAPGQKQDCTEHQRALHAHRTTSGYETDNLDLQGKINCSSGFSSPFLLPTAPATGPVESVCWYHVTRGWCCRLKYKVSIFIFG